MASEEMRTDLPELLGIFESSNGGDEAIAAAKAGVAGLAQSAAATYAGHNIRVNCVAPGLTRTPLTESLRVIFWFDFDPASRTTTLIQLALHFA